MAQLDFHKRTSTRFPQQTICITLRSITMRVQNKTTMPMKDKTNSIIGFKKEIFLYKMERTLTLHYRNPKSINCGNHACAKQNNDAHDRPCRKRN